MTERSQLFADGKDDGGPYSADDSRLLVDILGLAIGANIGVVPGQLNELAITSTGDNNITVDTGRAIVDGSVYESDASESKTTSSPSAGTTGRRAVLQKDSSNGRVRIAIISSDDGVAALPSLTQIDGVTWEIPLRGFTITTGGVIVLGDDEREFTAQAVAAGRFIARAGLTRWTMPGWMGRVQSGLGLDADVIYFTPILLQELRTFDRIGVEVTTLAAGEVARLGIYKADLAADGLTPGSLLLDAGTIDVSSTGSKEITISPQLLPAYAFLAMVIESTTPKFKGLDYTGSPIATPVVGRSPTVMDEVTDIILKTDANAGANWPGTGLPDPAPAVTGLARPDAAMVMLRDSS